MHGLLTNLLKIICLNYHNDFGGQGWIERVLGHKHAQPGTVRVQEAEREFEAENKAERPQDSVKR